MTDTINQEAAEIPGGLKWTEHDPVTLSWLVDADWSGTYKAEIREGRSSLATKLTEFTITASFDTVDWPDQTLFIATLTEAESLLVPKGKYYTDIQMEDGPTRLWACCHVGPQVTVL